VQGAMLTIDALGCPKEIAGKIMEDQGTMGLPSKTTSRSCIQPFRRYSATSGKTNSCVCRIANPKRATKRLIVAISDPRSW